MTYFVTFRCFSLVLEGASLLPQRPPETPCGASRLSLLYPAGKRHIERSRNSITDYVSGVSSNLVSLIYYPMLSSKSDHSPSRKDPSCQDPNWQNPRSGAARHPDPATPSGGPLGPPQARPGTPPSSTHRWCGGNRSGGVACCLLAV